MPKLSALVDDADGQTIIVPGVHAYATVTTTIYDEGNNKVEERRLFYGADHFETLPGGQKVNLKGPRNKNGKDTASEPAPETADETPSRGRASR